jgi:hypothetical protein
VPPRSLALSGLIVAAHGERMGRLGRIGLVATLLWQTASGRTGR